MFGLTLAPWKWLLRGIYSHGPWVGFLLIPFLTLVVMRTLQWWWSGRMPYLAEYSKAHLIGDVLLGVATGMLVRLSSRYGSRMSRRYWMAWIGLGAAIVLVHFFYKKSQGVMGSWLYMLEPTIFYHNVVLIGMLVPIMGGTTLMIVLNGGWRTWEFAVIAVMLGGYAFLALYWDPTHPHPEFRPTSDSLSRRYKNWVAKVAYG